MAENQPPPADGATQVAAAAVVARLPGALVGGLLAFLGRWALRLALPLLGASAALRAVPYQAVVGGVPFSVQGTLVGRPGLSADTTLGNWEFPDLSGLPVGVHISPRNVDLLQLVRAAQPDRAAYVAKLQADLAAQVPHIAGWLVGEALLGMLLGLAVTATVNMSLRYLRGLPHRPDELRRRVRQLGSALAVTAVVAGYGATSFNPDWVRESRLTGTLAAAQLFPGQLSEYYEGQSKAVDVLGSVLGIQAALQDRIAADRTPATAFRIMVVSDVHLAAVYPLIGRYAETYGVSLIVNAGDESEFGTAAELTDGYLDAVRAVTAVTPMLWLAGNHDSPEVQDTMAAVPGVTVLGGKRRTTDGYAVTAGVVDAYGLRIVGLPDPRVYGGPGAYGSDDDSVTDPLEQGSVRDALAGSTAEGNRSDTVLAAPAPGAAPRYDVVVTHEPVQAQEFRDALPGQIRQTISGHVHEQNDPADLQGGDGAIDLVEGSTGGGGLDNLARGSARPPVAFSIESVGAGCEFTAVERFRLRGSGVPSTSEAYGDDVVESTTYFRPQHVAAGRTCGTSLGISSPRPL